MARKPMIVRCSGLPVTAKCGMSLTAGGMKIDDADKGAANVGSAVHEHIAYWLIGARFDDAQIIDRWELDDEQTADYHKTTEWVKRQWEQVVPWEDEDMIVEGRIEFNDVTSCGDPIRISGQLDLCASYPKMKSIWFADLKTGWGYGDYAEQMKGYAWLLLQQVRKEYGTNSITEVVAVLWHARHWRAERLVFTAKELDEWMATLRKRLGECVYRHGSHCEWCPKRWDCPARATMLQSMTTALVTEAGQSEHYDIGSIEDMQAVWAKVKMLEKCIEGFKQDVKEYIRAHGPIQFEGALHLAIQTQNRKNIIWSRAKPIMEECLQTGQIDAAVKVSKTAIERAIKEPLGRGVKAKVWNEFMKRLEDEGAVSEYEIDMVKPLKIKTGDGDDSES